MSRRLRGSVSQRRYIFIGDTSSTSGAGLANLTHASSGLVAWYIAGDLSNPVQITLVSATLGTYTSGGFVAVSNSNMPGWYEIGVPDAAFDGGNQVAIQLRGATNMAPVNLYIDLDAVDYQTEAFGALRPTTAGRTLDVSAGGEAGIDLANVGSPTTTLNLSGVTISTSQQVASVTGAVASVTGNVGGNVLGYVGSINGVTFPSNFSLLGIDGAGAILTVSTVEELGVNALQANGLQGEIALAVWSEPSGATYVDGSFGDRILISQNNTRAIAVTGSGHIAAVLHDAEPDSIPEDAFVTSAISARALAPDAATEISTAVGLLTPLVDLGTMIINDGTGTARYSVSALQNAPSGGGGGGDPWATDIATGYTGTQAGNILIEVKAKTDLITSGSVQTSLPVTQTGQITGPLYIGDDYLNANGRAFSWTVALPSGFVVGTSVCKFGMELAEGTGGASFGVTGTVIDAGGGNVTLRFDVPRATTETLEPGFYRWSVEIASASGNEVTRVASDGRKLVEWREKQT